MSKKSDDLAIRVYELRETYKLSLEEISNKFGIDRKKASQYYWRAIKMGEIVPEPAMSKRAIDAIIKLKVNPHDKAKIELLILNDKLRPGKTKNYGQRAHKSVLSYIRGTAPKYQYYPVWVINICPHCGNKLIQHERFLGPGEILG